MYIEEHISINASPQNLFAIYTDVGRWSVWDPDTKSASLNGPAAVGTTGRLIPTKGRAVNMTVTECVPNERFTVDVRIPMFLMVFEHVITPNQNGVVATHRVTFSGALSFLLGTLIRNQLKHGLPKTMISLKHYAESRAQ